MTNLTGTFAKIEKQLLADGFSTVALDRRCSVFKSDTEIAYVVFLGIGRGFECTKYGIIAEA
jgi:hypothetical protein